jgi:hypothetical protein
MKTGKWSGKQLVILCLILTLGFACDQNEPQGEYTSIEGIFSCQESSAYSGIRNYLVEIDRVKGNEDLYIISNFHNKGENEFLYAELAQDTLWIFNQAISDISVDGKGPVGEDFRSIHLYYETDDGITVLDYYAIYTR